MGTIPDRREPPLPACWTLDGERAMRYYARSVGLRVLGAINALVVFVVFVVVGLQIEKGGDTFGEAVSSAIPLIVVSLLALAVQARASKTTLMTAVATPGWVDESPTHTGDATMGGLIRLFRDRAERRPVGRLVLLWAPRYVVSHPA
jgi:hypothetical protein